MDGADDLRSTRVMVVLALIAWMVCAVGAVHAFGVMVGVLIGVWGVPMVFVLGVALAALRREHRTVSDRQERIVVLTHMRQA